MSKAQETLLIAVAKGYKIDRYGTVHSPSGRVLKSCLGINGYMNFKVSVGYKCWRAVSLHRLQALTKFGDVIFAPKIQVRHLNGNRCDNSWDNIGVGTRQENESDKPPEVRERAIKAMQVINLKFTKEQADSIRVERANGRSVAELAGKYHCAFNTIYRIVRNESYV